MLCGGTVEFLTFNWREPVLSNPIHGVFMEENIDKIFNRKQQKPLRQQLRKNASPIERLLWAKLRGGQLGVKFRR